MVELAVIQVSCSDTLEEIMNAKVLPWNNTSFQWSCEYLDTLKGPHHRCLN